jgi:hypothetical protein
VRQPTRVGVPEVQAHQAASLSPDRTKAGLEAGEWTPREPRHSFVSLMKQLRPVLTGGAHVMDTLFALSGDVASEGLDGS